MLDLVFQNSTIDPPLPRLRRASKKYNSKFFEKILISSIKELKLNDKKIATSVNLVGEAKIKELNKKYRNKDKVTDVLSFPMVEKLSKKLQTTNYKLQDTDLGDIFICLPFAKKRAKSENVSIDKELARLTVHGFLHLLGYDHEKSGKEEERMFGIEEKILLKLKY